MEPKNKQERRKLYLRFLVVFIIAILIATVPIYLTMQILRQENKLTAQELQLLQDKIDFQRNFAVQIDSVNLMFDGYYSQSVDIDKLNADIGNLLSDMENAITEDTSWQSWMNITIIQTYLSLKKSNTSFIELQHELAKCKGKPVPGPEPVDEKKLRRRYRQ
jgi:cytochrome c oxidase assembly protein Cox11